MNIATCHFKTHGQAILEIFNDAILNTTALYEYEPRNLQVIEQWFTDKQTQGFPIIGAFSETGDLMGFASYGRFRPYPAFNTTVEHSIYVNKPYQGQGIAKQLLRELIKIATDNKAHVMIAAIDADNHASIRVHQQLGFQLSGTLPQVGFKFERWLDLLLYQKQLFPDSRLTSLS